MTKRIEPKILARIAIERAVVSRVVKGILAAGYSVSVDYGEDEPEVKGSHNAEEIMLALFTPDGGLVVDDARLYVDHDGKSVGLVYLVFGNDGYDVVCDYHVGLEPQLKEANAFADRVGDGELEALAECFAPMTFAEPRPRLEGEWPERAMELLRIAQDVINNAETDGAGSRFQRIPDQSDLQRLADKVRQIHNEAIAKLTAIAQEAKARS